jgi:hypothetical protein
MANESCFPGQARLERRGPRGMKYARPLATHALQNGIVVVSEQLHCMQQLLDVSNCIPRLAMPCHAAASAAVLPGCSICQRIAARGSSVLDFPLENPDSRPDPSSPRLGERPSPVRLPMQIMRRQARLQAPVPELLAAYPQAHLTNLNPLITLFKPCKPLSHCHISKFFD